VKDGDDSKLSTQDIAIIAEGPISVGEGFKYDFKKGSESMDKSFKKAAEAVKIHMITANKALEG